MSYTFDFTKKCIWTAAGEMQCIATKVNPSAPYSVVDKQHGVLVQGFEAPFATHKRILQPLSESFTTQQR